MSHIIDLTGRADQEARRAAMARLIEDAIDGGEMELAPGRYLVPPEVATGWVGAQCPQLPGKEKHDFTSAPAWLIISENAGDGAVGIKGADQLGRLMGEFWEPTEDPIFFAQWVLRHVRKNGEHLFTESEKGDRTFLYSAAHVRKDFGLVHLYRHEPQAPFWLFACVDGGSMPIYGVQDLLAIVRFIPPDEIQVPEKAWQMPKRPETSQLHPANRAMINEIPFWADTFYSSKYEHCHLGWGELVEQDRDLLPKASELGLYEAVRYIDRDRRILLQRLHCNHGGEKFTVEWIGKQLSAAVESVLSFA